MESKINFRIYYAYILLARQKLYLVTTTQRKEIFQVILEHIGIYSRENYEDMFLKCHSVPCLQ